ncbi:MAG: L-aspartate oxidase [Clostridia bacterium]|nr:L-aspartate oxidase [Clostridia bacterium]
MSYKTDILIVGSGVAGLYCALKLPHDKHVTVITKAGLEECDSWLAQGGICVLLNEQDYDAYYEDTLRAGHYQNDRSSVDIMIRSSRELIKDLVSYGVEFERDKNGELIFTKEGAHSAPRILFHEDVTGKEITSTLLEAVQKLPNVTLYEHTTMVDIIVSDGHCQGIVALVNPDSELGMSFSGPETDDGRLILAMEAKEVVWACGGIGGLFKHSTNFPHLTGDALGIAIKHGIRLRDPEYVQIHPTTLYTGKKGRSFLISESVRGEGGILLNSKGERFVDELQPRDVVSKAIFAEMEKTGEKHVWLSMENIPKETILHHFRNIYETCLKEGYDVTKEPIPVVPAQHYFMGGVDVNSDSRTSMPQLYAVGETSCNGVHGANRLASNSLLESLVFAQRAANRIREEFDDKKVDPEATKQTDLTRYRNTGKLFEDYKASILKEVERIEI